jgi:hypothetical protein
MRPSSLIKYLFYSIVFFTVTSCATNWFGNLWFKYDTVGRIPMEMYSKEVYSVKDTYSFNKKDISQKEMKFGAFSYFDAHNTGKNKFKIIEKDLKLTENISKLINTELKKSTFEIYQREELFFYLDSSLIDYGLSSFRKGTIDHEKLLNYFPLSQSEVGVFFAIAEISYQGECVFINSTSVKVFIYDKNDVIYSNAVAILNGYHIEIDGFISTREEDVSLAVNLLFEEFAEAYKKDN